jgi:CheY-like chemotaxis protein
LPDSENVAEGYPGASELEKFQTITVMKTPSATMRRTSPWFRLLSLFSRATSRPVPAAPAAPKPSTAANEVVPNRPVRGKILIVDDDAVIRKTTAMKLQSEGYSVLMASDGAAALQAVRTERPALILLDLIFPPDVAHGGNGSWDGFGLISWLRRVPEAEGVPIIMISGGQPAQYEQRALEAGALAFFQKPINHQTLNAFIERVLSDSSAETVGSPAHDFEV